MNNAGKTIQQISDIFLDTLKKEFPDQKILITYVVWKEEKNDILGSFSVTEDITLKDAAFMQAYITGQMMIEIDEENEEEEWKF